jgi:hypothetical protein
MILASRISLVILLILGLLTSCIKSQRPNNRNNNNDSGIAKFDTLNLPKISNVQIRFDRDTSNFHLGDTIKVDIRIPGISKDMITIACSNSKWMIDYPLDSFQVTLMPVRIGEMNLNIYLRGNDHKYMSIGKRKYIIKE